MAKRATTGREVLQELQNMALQYPETEAGTSCDKVAVKAKGKSFLFLGSADNACTVMLKLG